MKFLFTGCAILGGLALFFVLANRRTRRNPRKLTRDDVAMTIESFLSGTGGAYDWDDFLTFPIADPDLEALRQRCVSFEWETNSGREALQRELQSLRESAR